MTTPDSSSSPAPRKPLYTHLYVQVIIGVVLGIIVGGFWPKAGRALRPLGDGFIDLYRSGILKRRVYPSAKLQRLIDEGHIDERVSLRTLDALVEAGMSRMSFADFQEFREVGLFRDDVEYDRDGGDRLDRLPARAEADSGTRADAGRSVSRGAASLRHRPCLP